MQVGSGALACAALWHSSSSRPPYLRGRLPRQHSGEQSSCWRRGRKRRGFGPWAGRCRGEGNGNPLQYSCLESSMDRGARWASVRGLAECRQDRVQRSRTLLQLRLSLNSSQCSCLQAHHPWMIRPYLCLLGHWNREWLCSFPDATCPETFLSAHGNHKAMKM